MQMSFTKAEYESMSTFDRIAAFRLIFQACGHNPAISRDLAVEAAAKSYEQAMCMTARSSRELQIIVQLLQYLEPPQQKIAWGNLKQEIVLDQTIIDHIEYDYLQPRPMMGSK